MLKHRKVVVSLYPNTIIMKQVIESVKKFWGEYRWGTTCSFITALLVAEQDRLLTAGFFALFVSVGLFIFDKMYKS